MNLKELQKEAEKNSKKELALMKGWTKKQVLEKLYINSRIHGLTKKDSIAEIKYAVIDALGIWISYRRLLERENKKALEVSE